jgi:hypothetical protein
MQVSAHASVAVAMPQASDRWQLDEVSVDARGTLAVAAMASGAHVWVPLHRGRHTRATAGGRPAGRESIQLAFPSTARASST